MANERILIIDSAIECRRFIADEILQPQGYQALVAGNDDEGARLALAEQPDLILLDMLQPEPAINILRSLQQNIECPVVIMIAQGVESMPLQLLRLGAQDYVTKPVLAAELLAALERALNGERLRRERDNLTTRLIQADWQLDQHRRELNTLFGIGKSITALRNPDQLLRRLVEAAIYLTNAEESSILLLDEETEELYVAATRGMDDRVARSLRIRVDDSLAGETIRKGQAFVLNETDIKKVTTDYLVRSLMYVPISAKGKVKGVFGVSNRRQAREFANHDLRLLSALSDYAAIFLENIQLSKHIENEQTKLMILLDALEQPLAIIRDYDNRIIMTNAAFRHTFDLGQTLDEGDLQPEVLKNQALVDFMMTPGVDNHHREIFLNDERTFAVTSIPIPEIGRAIIMEDVTDLKTLNQMKSDFISTASHTLQAPLVSIREYADMLQTTGPLTEKQEIFFDRISGGLEKIIALVNDLLDLSNVEGAFDLNPTVFDLNYAVTEVVVEFQNQARHKHQQLVYHSPNQPAYVVGAPLHLKRVIAHLIDNAVKYTPEKGHISIITQINGEQVLLKVEDNGAGIAPADLPFVFDKFFRADQQNRSGVQGTGLGLAICKSIIEKYGGSIWVESASGKGSTFFVILPLASPQTIETANNNLPNTEALTT